MSTKKSHSQAPGPPLSSFYLACRNNDVDTVAALLPKLSANDIDRVEPNGSTALHAASYYGHGKIVKMLLARGAQRTIKNRYGSTPYEEAKTDEIRALFLTPEATESERKDRYVSESNAEYEWIVVDGHPASYASFNRESLLKCKDKSDFLRLTRGIREQYINENGPLANEKRIDQVRTDFDEAMKSNDPIPVVRAYTRETGFYSRLNRDLSLIPTNWSGIKHERNFVSILMFHPDFQQERTFTGVIYRGMIISSNDFKKYKVGGVFMNKTLLSASKVPDRANEFLQRNKASDKLKIIGIYKVKNAGTAVDIESYSVLPEEKEVVILPYAAFRVRTIREPTDKHNGVIEIHMEEEDRVIWQKAGSSSSSHTHVSTHKSTGVKSSGSGSYAKMFKDAKEKGAIDPDDMKQWQKDCFGADPAAAAFAQVWSDAQGGQFKAANVKKWQQQIGDHTDLGIDSDDDDQTASFSASNEQSYTTTKTFSSKKQVDWKKFMVDDSDD